MACDGYSCSALMGNWAEEKLSFRQPSRLFPGQREAREDSDIKFISGSGAIMELAKTSRNKAWNTKAVVLDQGQVTLIVDCSEIIRLWRKKVIEKLLLTIISKTVI